MSRRRHDEPSSSLSARRIAPVLLSLLERTHSAVDAEHLLAAMPPVLQAHVGRQLRVASAVARARPHYQQRKAFVLPSATDSGVIRVTTAPVAKIDVAARRSAAGHALAAVHTAHHGTLSVSIYSQLDADQRAALADLRRVVMLRLDGADVDCLPWLPTWDLLKFHAQRCSLRRLPPQLAAMCRLRIVDVADNAIEALPDDPSLYVTLSFLNVSANRLEALPSALQRARSLCVLIASSNRLRPDSLGRMPRHLRELDVTGNPAIRRLDDVLDAVADCIYPMEIGIGALPKCRCDEQTAPEQLENCRAATE